ncbi:MAG: site-specific DNA-methyltransferase, partial [Alphaproteobacteria bacterium]|nr:site-specific DNA-methyltransferase [Alphaproteobacteria bacterium]
MVASSSSSLVSPSSSSLSSSSASPEASATVALDEGGQCRRAQLLQLFPECRRAVFDEEGKEQGVIDVPCLLRALGAEQGGHKHKQPTEPTQLPPERYQLEWPGKRLAASKANDLTTDTLQPMRDASVEFDRTQNLFIEGDNLTALRIMHNSYRGKVKLILIDPPYNTGNGFVYNDNFTQPRQGSRQRKQTTDAMAPSSQPGSVPADPADLAEHNEHNERNERNENEQAAARYHSAWLSMMYPRLKIARQFLRDDGLVMVCIDDHEAHNLRHLMDELYGAENHLATLKVQMSTTQGMKVAAAKRGTIVKNGEYVLCYAKNAASHRFTRPLYESKGW